MKLFTFPREQTLVLAVKFFTFPPNVKAIGNCEILNDPPCALRKDFEFQHICATREDLTLREKPQNAGVLRLRENSNLASLSVFCKVSLRLLDTEFFSSFNGVRQANEAPKQPKITSGAGNGQ